MAGTKAEWRRENQGAGRGRETRKQVDSEAVKIAGTGGRIGKEKVMLVRTRSVRAHE